MSRGMQIVGIIVLSLLALGAINLVINYTSGNELDYNLLKDTTEASMLEAVDLDFYANSNGQIRMDKDKFVESFVRRFAESVANNRDYHIQILDVNETPPKVSVKVESGTVATFNGERAQIVNKIDAILETKYQESRSLEEVLQGEDKLEYVTNESDFKYDTNENNYKKGE